MPSEVYGGILSANGNGTSGGAAAGGSSSSASMASSSHASSMMASSSQASSMMASSSKASSSMASSAAAAGGSSSHSMTGKLFPPILTIHCCPKCLLIVFYQLPLRPRLRELLPTAQDQDQPHQRLLAPQAVSPLLQALLCRPRQRDLQTLVWACFSVDGSSCKPCLNYCFPTFDVVIYCVCYPV